MRLVSATSAVKVGIAIVAVAVLATGCERSPQSSPPEPSPATQPAAAKPPTAIETESDFLRNLRRSAEAGDVNAMMTLGQAYQTRGGQRDRAEARKWYEKALAAGDASATAALAGLAAADKLAEATAAIVDGDPSSAATNRRGPGSATNPTPSTTWEPTTRPTTTHASADPAKVSWDEILASFDTGRFVGMDRPDYKNSFAAIATAEDQTMIIAGMGPTRNEMRNVQVLIRIRSRQQPADSERVRHASNLCSTVTRENVTHEDLIRWVGNYLSSEQAAEPIFRNGWQINVSGPIAEGKIDRKDFLGRAVKIELSR